MMSLFYLLCILSSLYLLIFLYKPWKKQLDRLTIEVETSTNTKTFTAESSNVTLVGADLDNSTLIIKGSFTGTFRLLLDSYRNIYSSTKGSSNEFLNYTIVNETGATLQLFDANLNTIGGTIANGDIGLYVTSVAYDPYYTTKYIGKTAKLA